MSRPDMAELAYHSDEAAGLDLVLNRWRWGDDLPWWTDDLHLDPGQSTQIATGVKVAIPPVYARRLIMRSGLGIKRGLVVHAGLIDSDYRGEIKSRITNQSLETVTIPRWSRILNLVIFPVLQPRIERVADVAAASPTARGDGGLGSTGA